MLRETINWPYMGLQLGPPARFFGAYGLDLLSLFQERQASIAVIPGFNASHSDIRPFQTIERADAEKSDGWHSCLVRGEHG